MVVLNQTYEGTVSVRGAGITAQMAALGAEFSGHVAAGRFRITMPIAGDYVPNMTRLQTPFPGNHHFQTVDSDWGWGYVTGWGEGDELHLKAQVYGAAISATLDSPESTSAGPDADLVWCFGKQFNDWYAVAARWIGVRTFQHVEPDNNWGVRTRGMVWSTPDGASPIDWVNEPPTVGRHNPDGEATREHLLEAFDNASKKIDPPLEWMALVNADRLIDDRLAVIEAASAAEIGLARAIKKELSGVTKASERIVLNANGIEGLFSLLKELTGKELIAADGEPLSRSRIMHQLARPRNLAVHGGQVPDTHATLQAIHTSYELLRNVSPLPISV